MLNLIHDAWIPVTRRDGTREVIPPWKLTDAVGENPVTAISTPRPDLNAALVQFLIGLVQTTYPPEDDVEWVERAIEPPSPETLRGSFEPVSGAFFMDGNGPRFMQDLTLTEGDTWDVQKLFFGMPGEQTLKQNKDLFLKRDTIQVVCVPCAAMALYCVQTNTGGLGKGHRTSLRGGGPLTTVVTGNTLWQTVWLNVLESRTFNSSGETIGERRERAFPWLAPTRTSEKNETTTPDDVHPAQMFFPMPIRIRLMIENKPCTCDICGGMAGESVRSFQVRSYGVNYSGNWNHPLTPYMVSMKDKETRSKKMSSGGIVYQHWLGLLQRSSSEKSDFVLDPARCVSSYKGKKDLLTEYLSDVHPRLWAFGYEVDSGKARAWYEGTLPVITVNRQVQADFEAIVEQVILAAKFSASSLQYSASHAMYKEPKNIRGGPKKFSFIDEDFWHVSETSFYSILGEISGNINSGFESQEMKTVKERWIAALSKVCLSLYDRYADSDLVGERDPKRIAVNRRSLEYRISLRNPDLCTTLHLALPEGAKSKKTRGKKSS